MKSLRSPTNRKHELKLLYPIYDPYLIYMCILTINPCSQPQLMGWGGSKKCQKFHKKRKEKKEINI